MRLKSSITQDRPHKKDGAEQSMKYYWPIRHEPPMIVGIAMRKLFLFYYRDKYWSSCTATIWTLR